MNSLRVIPVSPELSQEGIWVFSSLSVCVCVCVKKLDEGFFLTLLK